MSKGIVMLQLWLPFHTDIAAMASRCARLLEPVDLGAPQHSGHYCVAQGGGRVFGRDSSAHGLHPQILLAHLLVLPLPETFQLGTRHGSSARLQLRRHARHAQAETQRRQPPCPESLR
jgi:hypothetical protein